MDSEQWDNLDRMKDEADARREDHEAASARPISTTEGSVGALAVATCSVPVSEAEALLSEWREARDEAYRQRDVLRAKSSRCADDAQIEGEMWDRCIMDLSLLVAAAKKRQPAQNRESSAMTRPNSTSDNSTAPCAALAGAGGSESSTHWTLEGQRKQDPRRWDAIGHNADSEAEARDEERSYREYMIAKKTGWLDFRVVRVTTTREILPNTQMCQTHSADQATQQLKT